MNLSSLILRHPCVVLRPFDIASDGAELRALAARAPEIFGLWSHRGPGDWVGRWINVIAERTANGTMIAFAVTSPDDGAFWGVTSYIDPHTINRGVEVGMTCYAPEVQGTLTNPAAKLLLLQNAFEAHGALRVQFQVDRRNQRSQAAVLKLGAIQEGIVRSHRVLEDGHVRDTVLFSILASEWPSAKEKLLARLPWTDDQGAA